MNADEVAKAPGPLNSVRFSLVGYLPTGAAALFLLWLVWAGAPGDDIQLNHAWSTAKNLSVGQILGLVLCVALLAVLLQPLQAAMIRWLEGYWPDRLATLPRRYQLWRRARLLRDSVPTSAAEEELLRAGRSGLQVRSRFPLPDRLVRPTALGNALSAMEDHAGRDYGLDAVVAWPRLYILLRPEAKALVDDRRDTLDLACRLVWTGLFSAVASAVLLFGAGRWMLLTLVPLGIAALAYQGAVRSAVAYGEAVHVAFDLHHCDLRALMLLREPTNLAEERADNRSLCAFWRQGIPLGHTYVPPERVTGK